MATKKKSASKKSQAKKTVKKKVTPKKTVKVKGAGKQVKKAAPRKTAVKKTAPKKAAPKKTAVKKAAPLISKERDVSKDTSFNKQLETQAKDFSVDKQSGAEESSSGKGTFVLLLILVAVICVYFLFIKKPADKDAGTTVDTSTTALVTDETKKDTKQDIEKTVDDTKKTDSSTVDKKTSDKDESLATDSDSTLYTVKYNDRLTIISKRHYGTYKDWRKIYKANMDIIKNPGLIFPGQKLKIPKK